MSIDSEKLFSIFDSSEVNKKLEDQRKKLNEFKTTPHFMIGMFIKYIKNTKYFLESVKKLLKEEGSIVSLEAQEKVTNRLIFEESYKCISTINISKKDHLKSIQSFNPHFLHKSLHEAIHYFESEEEYEKCAFLLQIQNKVKI